MGEICVTVWDLMTGKGRSMSPLEGADLSLTHLITNSLGVRVSDFTVGPLYSRIRLLGGAPGDGMDEALAMASKLNLGAEQVENLTETTNPGRTKGNVQGMRVQQSVGNARVRGRNHERNKR